MPRCPMRLASSRGGKIGGEEVRTAAGDMGGAPVPGLVIADHRAPAAGPIGHRQQAAVRGPGPPCTVTRGAGPVPALRNFTQGAGWQLQNLGTLGGPYGRAQAVNNLGQVVGQASDPSGSSLSPFIWLPVAAYGLVQIALRRAEASLVAAYIYLQPIITATAAMFLLDEQPTLRVAVCGAIVLFGVWLAARRAR